MQTDLYKRAAQEYQQITLSQQRGCLGMFLPLPSRLLTRQEIERLEGLQRELWETVPKEYRESPINARPEVGGIIAVLCEQPMTGANKTQYKNMLALSRQIEATLQYDLIARM